MPELTVIRWRDIPAQVTATDGERTARAQLSERFQKAIDAAAMKAGLVDADTYLEEWRRETRPCGEKLEAEVAAEAERLEREYTRDVLLGLTRAGGARGGTGPAPPWSTGSAAVGPDLSGPAVSPEPRK